MPGPANRAQPHGPLRSAAQGRLPPQARASSLAWTVDQPPRPAPQSVCGCSRPPAEPAAARDQTRIGLARGGRARRRLAAMRGMLRAAACTALLASHAHAGALGPGSLGFSAPCTSGLAPLASAPHRACAGGAGASSTRPQHVAMIGGGGRRSARRLTGPGARMAMSSDSFVKAGGSDDAAAPLGDAAGSPAVVQKNWLQVLWDFSRPHTIVGSVLSVVSLHLFAATAPGATLLNLSALGVALAWAIVCAVLVNIYVTGLNQVFDVEIDKINKPYLPIAAGQLSLPAAWAICVGALLLGTVPSILFYPFDKAPLLTVTVGSALLGTAYSAPPTRLKRFPLFAALCIIVVSRRPTPPHPLPPCPSSIHMYHACARMHACTHRIRSHAGMNLPQVVWRPCAHSHA